MQIETDASLAARQADRVGGLSRTHWRRLAIAAMILIGIALIARVMSYPLQHDEQFYVPAGVLFSWHGLYKDLGFSHLPNLPLLLTALYRVFGTHHYLLVGRVVILVSWLTACGALLMIGRDYVHSRLVTALMVSLLVFNMTLLEATGMAVTNNFIPVPFALLGFYAFLKATDRPDPDRFWAAMSGLLLAIAAGFKANYVLILIPFAVAAFLVPVHVTLGERIRRVVLPMLVGSLIGGAPTLAFLLADPSGFVAHVFSFHRGPQIGYWNAHPDPLDPKAMSLRDKIMMANGLWFSGVRLVMVMGIVFLTVLGIQQGGSLRRIASASTARWPVPLAASLMLLAMLGSFAPTPAFPQYFTPFIPFGIVLLGLMYAALDGHRRAMARPFVIAALAVTTLIGAPVLLASLPKLMRPGNWTGIRVHADAEKIAAQVRATGNAAPVATLAPLHVLEGGLDIYPHLAMGPFVYRAVPWIPQRDLSHFKYVVAPDGVPALLDANPPSAILVGFEKDLDQPFAIWGTQAGYQAHAMKLGATDGGKTGLLFIAPPVLLPGAPPAPATAAQPTTPSAPSQSGTPPQH